VVLDQDAEGFGGHSGWHLVENHIIEEISEMRDELSRLLDRLEALEQALQAEE
jgi:hypothetical protein